MYCEKCHDCRMNSCKCGIVKDNKYCIPCSRKNIEPGISTSDLQEIIDELYQEILLNFRDLHKMIKERISRGK